MITNDVVSIHWTRKVLWTIVLLCNTYYGLQIVNKLLEIIKVLI